mmetsp:Transcript_26738/g.56065  ORF Transcript_26738/g.56065 Transcript_26738/m.56065 type:complete len:94 (-) Transcript_26738:497-778(-)
MDAPLCLCEQVYLFVHHRRRNCPTTYKTPTFFNMPSNFPLSSNFTIPPKGPSLQPPTNSPPIQIAGTEVRPNISPISARIAFPSPSTSSSTTL